MNFRFSKSVTLVATLVVAAMVPAALVAQDAAKPTAKTTAASPASRWDIFAGYSYLNSQTTVATPENFPVASSAAQAKSNASADPDYSVSTPYDSRKAGLVASGTYFFNRYFGAQVEAGYHDGRTVNRYDDNYGAYTSYNRFMTFSGGAIFRYPTGNFTPFVHALVGAARVEGPFDQPATWAPSATGGVGLDYELPWLNHHFAVRLIQADYLYARPNFGTTDGGTVDISAARLSAGLVYHIGTIAPPPPLTLVAVANPTAVYPGDPVAVTATAGNVLPRQHVAYIWSGAGVTGDGANATVATAALAPGAYTVKVIAKEGRGSKPWETAEASANFTVKQVEPPTVSCSANPSTIRPGESSTITAAGVSPQNRPLTYSYSASAGEVTGNGSTATFSSVGAPTGLTTITCTALDDKGQSATSTVGISVGNPEAAPLPRTEALAPISFGENSPRVDNKAKAILDDEALQLQKQPDATAVAVGESASQEKGGRGLAAQRAENTKTYLVAEKGIDASRVNVATGTANSQTVENYLVPAGAHFTSDVHGTTPVGKSVKASAEKKHVAAKAHKKAAAKKAAK